ncbi:hypothetical protein ACHAPT_007827 [Fusarium lateritium]
MAPARQQPAPPPFSKDEKVLCFHMDMLYEAKIMDVQAGEKPGDGYKYKVHYKGWKNTWDDWVLVDRIRPFDDEHKELAAQLHAQLKHNMQRSSKPPKKGLRSGAESARVSEERSGSATIQGSRGGRRGKDWELEQVRPLYVLYCFEFSALCMIFYEIPDAHPQSCGLQREDSQASGECPRCIQMSFSLVDWLETASKVRKVP